MTNAILPNLIEVPADRSSQIGAIGYDAECLFVQFRRGGLYVYDKVTPAEYQALMAANRIGEYFAKAIKGVKPWKKVAESTAAAPAPAATPEKAAPKGRATKAAAAKTTALARTSPTKVLSMPATNAPKTDDLANAAKEWAAKATAVKITSVDTHASAQNMLLEIDTIKKRIVETWKPMKAAAFAAHRAVCDKENELLAPLTEADRLLRARIGEYTYAQLRAAQVEDEKRRLAAESEARANAVRETEENALAAAEELAAMGDHEGAEAVLTAPMPVPIRYEAPMPVQPAVAAVAGVSGGIAYEATIHDLAQVPREYLVVDVARTEAEIARRAKQAQGRMQVPGVTIRETYATRRVGVRGSR